MTSVMNLRVPRSMPLAQAMTGVPARSAWQVSATTSRKACAGTTSSIASHCAASCRVGCDRNALVDPCAGQHRRLSRVA